MINNQLIDDDLYKVETKKINLESVSIKSYSGQPFRANISTPSGYKFVRHIFGCCEGKDSLIGHLEDSINENNPMIYIYNASPTDINNNPAISLVISTLYRKII